MSRSTTTIKETLADTKQSENNDASKEIKKSPRLVRQLSEDQSTEVKKVIEHIRRKSSEEDLARDGARKKASGTFKISLKSSQQELTKQQNSEDATLNVPPNTPNTPTSNKQDEEIAERKSSPM